MPDPQPKHPPVARTSWPHRRLGDALAPLATIAALATTGYVDIPVAGARLVTIRGKIDKAASITPLFLDPTRTPYATNQPAAIAATANTEFLSTVTCHGEGLLRILVPGHATDVTTVAFIDTMALPTS